MRARLDDEVLIVAEDAGRARCSARTPRSLEELPGAALVGRQLQGPDLRRSPTAGRSAPPARRPSGSSPGTSSPPRTAPASSTSRRPSARTTTGSAPPAGLFDPHRREHPLQPGPPRRHLRRPSHRLRRRVRERRVRRPARLIDHLDRARPALPRAGLRARLPALLALRHAAALLRDLELVRRHLRGQGRAARQQRDDRLAPRARQARPLRQMAGEQRRLGALAQPLLGDAAADLALRRRGLRRRDLHRLGRGAGRALGGEVPDDLHRPYIDEVTLRCEDCGGNMHRVSSVIDTWYDSGAMPFAQFHYPFEGQEEFDERFPADYICEAQDQTRGWFYTLLAESTLLFDESSFRNCVCLGLILDPEGQKMSKSRGNVVDPWDVLAAHGADAFRWYYLTTQQPWAGYRFSVDTVGESVRHLHAHALEHLLVLGALRERRGHRPAESLVKGSGPMTTTTLRRTRPTSTAGRSPGCRRRSRRARADGRLRLHHRRPGDRRLRRGALQLVRAALAAALLGGRRGGLRDAPHLPARDGDDAGAVHPVPRRRDLPQPRRAAPTASSASGPTRSTSPTSRRSTRRSSTPTWKRRWPRSAARSASATPPAPPAR